MVNFRKVSFKKINELQIWFQNGFFYMLNTAWCAAAEYCLGLRHNLPVRVRSGKTSQTPARFVIQLKGAAFFTPNKETDPLFAATLKKASENGVNILAYDCVVEPDCIYLSNSVPVIL